MRLDYDFLVPRQVDQAWAVMTDLERLAPCLPGAALTEVGDDGYHGTVRVKVGPVVAQYAGVAKFRELDEDAHHAVLEAKGKERSGRGLASAVVTADLSGEGEQTRVRVGTDLTISGALAQFGRGAISEISERLFAQFIERLKESLDAEAPADAPTPPAEPAAPPEPAAMPPAETSPAPPVGEAPVQPASTEPVAEPVPAQPVRAAQVEPADLLRVAGLPILKRLVPVLVVLAIVIVVLVVWLS
jgi:carbon monoxide dehydrogenase subunit G